MSRAEDENDGQATERVVIRDRRKINPNGKSAGESVSDAKETKAKESKRASGGAHRAADPEEGAEVVAEKPAAAPESPSPSTPAPPPPPALGAELEALRHDLEERTRDLQRVTAEYANYRKRVDRDRGAAAEQTTGAVLTTLLPVLDDIDRAREHDDLKGPFATVAEVLTAATGKFGLVAFGEKGDPFDPTRHEAVAHLTSPDVKEPTCVEVMRRGYTLGERLLRPALVAVADPE
ncbi:nucleotide exchange factor GrpE [Actinoplanes sp. NPDC051470]|uniref:nucleotide exchange factor GrpE n=1 Tax=Actinoplanes sp. NPDC051470 TaxID=3157224 RepID=UPI0034296945